MSKCDKLLRYSEFECSQPKADAPRALVFEIQRAFWLHKPRNGASRDARSILEGRALPAPMLFIGVTSARVRSRRSVTFQVILTSGNAPLSSRTMSPLSY
jgi:hypothetical protein